MTLNEIIAAREEGTVTFDGKEVTVKRVWENVGIDECGNKGWLTKITIGRICTIRAKEDGWSQTTIAVRYMTAELQKWLKENGAVKRNEFLWVIPTQR